MIRYYCSGFDAQNAFGYGIGEMLKVELKDKHSILYVPGFPENREIMKEKYVYAFTKYFEKVGILFDQIHFLTPDVTLEEAKELIYNASMIMLMGGDPFEQKEMCKQLDILNDLRNYDGVMMGISAGAMLMSKYIIITPCSKEYPDFHIEEGLNLDEISVYPHNNTLSEVYPDMVLAIDGVYKKQDLLMVAKKYGEFYLLQDCINENGLTDISIIKSNNGNIEYYTENNGKLWIVEDDINLVTKQLSEKRK